MNIQWYPGHMTKTRRTIEADLKLVDCVCELLDARIPVSSRNPDIDSICGDKPRMIILNRIDQADPEITRQWAEYYKSKKIAVIQTDCKTRNGIADFAPGVRALLKDQIARWNEKGLVGRKVRAMIVGIPNVGKSTFINQVAKRKSAKVENRPGVTRGKQWVSVDKTLDLLDTPGILWHKFEDETVGLHLAFTGAVKDNILDVEALASKLMELLGERYPERLAERYKIDASGAKDGWELLERAGRKRGFLVSGGEVDTGRISRILLDEFRDGKLGRISLEAPEPGAENRGADE